jgi:hypothetical protein
LDKKAIARIKFEPITELLTAVICKNSKYISKTTDSKIINIANCKTFKKELLDGEYVILGRYYCHSAKTGTLHVSTDGPTGQPAGNLPNSARLEDICHTIPELPVGVYFQPGLPNW